MLSPLAYSILVGVVIIQRVVELSLASSHARKLMQKGAYAVGEKNYFKMKLLHTSFFFALAVEGLWHYSPPGKNLFFSAIVLFLLGQFLRLSSIVILGERWTTKVYVVPEHSRIRNGLYCFFPHPNYLGVVLELWALPMLGGLWWTAVIFFLANLYVLSERVKIENEALLLSETDL